MLVLNAGPYFWPHQKATRRRYELLSQRFSGHILSFVPRPEFREAQIGNFRFMGWPLRDRWYRLLPLRLCLRVFRTLVSGLVVHLFRNRVDLIIAYDPFVTGLLAYMLSRLIGARYIVEVNGDYGDPSNWTTSDGKMSLMKSWQVHHLIPFVVNRADAVRCLYKGQLDPFIGLRHQEKYFQFSDFVATSLFSEKTISQRYLLFIGFQWYRKGVDILIRAFNMICNEFPDFTLKIVGHFPEKEQHQDLFLYNRQIEFVGPVFPDAVPDLMERCYAFVLASRSEGMPRVLVEAMASRKPIIASRVSGIPQYITHEETGLLFDKEDVEGLAAQIRRIISDPALAERLAENGYRYMQAHLSEECYLESFTRLVSAAQSNSSVMGQNTRP